MTDWQRTNARSHRSWDSVVRRFQTVRIWRLYKYLFSWYIINNRSWISWVPLFVRDSNRGEHMNAGHDVNRFIYLEVQPSQSDGRGTHASQKLKLLECIYIVHLMVEAHNYNRLWGSVLECLLRWFWCGQFIGVALNTSFVHNSGCPLLPPISIVRLIVCKTFSDSNAYMECLNHSNCSWNMNLSSRTVGACANLLHASSITMITITIYFLPQGRAGYGKWACLSQR